MKQLHFAFILLFFLHFKLFSQMENQVVEVVLYKVKLQSDLNFITKGVNKEIANFEGFVSRETFQSFKDENLLLDWVVWESLAQAEKAASELPHKETLSFFMQSIEKVELFDHFEVKYFAGKNQSINQTSILELVIYKIKNEKLKEVEPIFQQVSTELQGIEGFQSRKTGVSFKESNKFVDFLIWESLETAQNSMKIVEQNLKILPFFEMNEETIIFEHFKSLF